MATFSFQGHKAHVSFTRNNRGTPQWDLEAAGREGTEGDHPDRGEVAERDGRHGLLDFMRDSI